MNTANPVIAANASAIASGYSVSEITKRCLSAIAECDRFISKEEPRSSDLRPASVQKTLDHYKAHRLNLIAAIAELAQ
jgi:hypothetical protein